MKLVINVPDYIKEQADDGKCEEFGIPLWLAIEIANGTQIPKVHGRIIDESQVTGTFTWDNGFIECFAPTIIKADKGESEVQW